MDVEKTIELIAVRLQQVADAHAVLAADQQQMSAHQQQLTAHQERLAADQERQARLQLELAQEQSRQQEAIGHIVNAVGQVTISVRELAAAVGELRDHAERTDLQIREMNQRMGQGFQELREAEQQTRENLDALIKIVDDLIRRDGRGKRS